MLDRVRTSVALTAGRIRDYIRTRRLFSRLLELAGFAALTWAAWGVDHRLGFTVGGVCLLVLGYATGGRR